MAAPWNPIIKGQDLEFSVGLRDYNNPGLFKSNPTLAAGDVKLSKDGGALANLATLPSVAPAGSTGVHVELTGTEMTFDEGFIIFHDQTVPPEWCDLKIPIVPTQA